MVHSFQYPGISNTQRAFLESQHSETNASCVHDCRTTGLQDYRRLTQSLAGWLCSRSTGKSRLCRTCPILLRARPPGTAAFDCTYTLHHLNVLTQVQVAGAEQLPWAPQPPTVLPLHTASMHVGPPHPASQLQASVTTLTGWTMKDRGREKAGSSWG